jgi:hypothetical protein
MFQYSAVPSYRLRICLTFLASCLLLPVTHDRVSGMSLVYVDVLYKLLAAAMA